MNLFALFDRKVNQFVFVQDWNQREMLGEKKRYVPYGSYYFERVQEFPTFSPSQLRDFLTWASRNGKRTSYFVGE